MTIAGGKKQTAESIKAAYPEANPKRKSRSSESTQGQKAEATGVEQLRTEVGKTRTSDEPEHDMDDDDFSKRSSQNLDLLRDLMIDKENDERSSLFAASSPPEIGNLHLAGQDHIRHMIRVKGAVRLVKELGLELAKRDAQVTLAKQRSEIWKRAFNKLLHQHELANLADTQHSAEIIQETHDALRELSEANIAIALSGAAADVMSAELVSATDVISGRFKEISYSSDIL